MTAPCARECRRTLGVHRCRPGLVRNCARGAGIITPGSGLRHGSATSRTSHPPRSMGPGSAPCRRWRGVVACPGRLWRLERERSISKTCVRVPAARSPEFCCLIHPPSNERVQGMPGEGLTHGPPAKRMQAAGTTGKADQPAFPARCLHAYTQSPWCAGLVGHHTATTRSRALRG